FVMYVPGGLVGLWAKVSRRWNPPAEESAAMSRRKIHEGLPLPAFLRPEPVTGEVLDVQGVSRNFGGIQAVKGASLDVRPGEIHALIGPNGAGKTTLFNLISGMFAPAEGRIRLLGRDIGGEGPAAICRAGLARSFQITNLFNGLSIEENLRLSIQAKHPARFNVWRDFESYGDINAETAELMKFLGLEGMEGIRGGDLSYGGQRLVDLGIALASKPQMLLLDEPLAGLAAAERERMGRLVTTMARNIPILIVEHDIDRVLGFSQRVTVMNEGQILMTGCPDDVRNSRRVQEIYTGTGTPAVTGRSAAGTTDARPILKVEGLNTFYGKSHVLHDARLEVRQGEIVALLGRRSEEHTTELQS